VTETLSRIAIPLSGNTPLKSFYEATYTHTYTETGVRSSGTRHEWSRDHAIRTPFMLRLGKMMCTAEDVTTLTGFLRELIAQKATLETLTLPVAKPVLTPAELRLMGVSEVGRHAVYFPETEQVTFTIFAPDSHRKAVKEVLKAVSSTPSSAPARPVRDLMASAYLTTWKAQRGNWMKDKPPFMEQTGLADLHMSCLVSFEAEALKAFAKRMSCPPKAAPCVLFTADGC